MLLIGLLLAGLSVTVGQIGVALTDDNWTAQDIDDPAVQRRAHEAVLLLSHARNGTFAMRLSKISSAKFNANIMGALLNLTKDYEFVLEMAETQCRKCESNCRSLTDGQNCHFRSNGVKERCQVGYRTYAHPLPDTPMKKITWQDCAELKF